MSSAARRVAIIAGAAVILVVAFLLLSGGSDKGSTSTTAGKPASSASSGGVPTVRVVGAKPQGGVQKLSFKKGDTVKFRVVSDTADEIHVHGYDFHKDVAKGGTVTFSFPGKIEGRFVVELEGKGEQIAQLDVVP